MHAGFLFRCVICHVKAPAFIFSFSFLICLQFFLLLSHYSVFQCHTYSCSTLTKLHSIFKCWPSPQGHHPPLHPWLAQKSLWSPRVHKRNNSSDQFWWQSARRKTAPAVGESREAGKTTRRRHNQRGRWADEHTTGTTTEGLSASTPNRIPLILCHYVLDAAPCVFSASFHAHRKKPIPKYVYQSHSTSKIHLYFISLGRWHFTLCPFASACW